MAEASVTVDQNQFTCAICLDLLKDPVAIPCGHNYCMSCIKSCWDQEDHPGVYSCPQCRETFTPRPVLGRNTMLAEVPHYESPAFKKHKLTDATGHLQDKVCSHHDKPLESYCRTDQQCICHLCTMYEHRGHDTVSAAAEREEIQVRNPSIKVLKMFIEMICSIQRRRSEVTKLIRDQEKAAVSQVKGHMERLKQEIDELKRRHSELEQLSHTEDHIHLIQLTLDPNTANKHLQLSKGNRVVTWKEETQSYPDHWERFVTCHQVLCTEGLTGCCYWEVKWSGGWVGIAVTYKGIDRERGGEGSRLGYNDKSWCLYCSGSSYSFRHNTVQTAVSGPPSPRIGVYLDHGAGTLSFYSVSDTVTLLHRVQTTFTEPLYPGFFLWNSAARLY
uniref:Tripartite motif-containing protein 16-like n=1 Tax=Paramormyrops kingsleyae TaxID=1676925 RepID=A0A3B3RTJ0_9TELE